jgi:hypothetical protein
VRIYDPPLRRSGRFYPQTAAEAAAVLDEALLMAWAYAGRPSRPASAPLGHDHLRRGPRCPGRGHGRAGHAARVSGGAAVHGNYVHPPDGVARYTDPTPTHELTVGQVRFEPGGRLEVGNEIPNVPHASKGGFCADTIGVGIYRWSLHGGALVVRAVNNHQCAGRNSFWNGTFAR